MNGTFFLLLLFITKGTQTYFLPGSARLVNDFVHLHFAPTVALLPNFSERERRTCPSSAELKRVQCTRVIQGAKELLSIRLKYRLLNLPSYLSNFVIFDYGRRKSVSIF